FGYYDLTNDTSNLATYKASLRTYNNPILFSSYDNTPKHIDTGYATPTLASINNTITTDKGLVRYLDTFKSIDTAGNRDKISLNTGALEIGEVVTINVAYFSYGDAETVIGNVNPYLE